MEGEVKPYYADNAVTLYNADFRDVLASVKVEADCIIADPPYGETSLAWDRWPDSWPTEARRALAPGRGSMWCFGSMRMFLSHAAEFAGWKFAQDVVWEKQAGSGFDTDRFKRVHENALQFYPSEVAWGDVFHETPRERVAPRPAATIAQNRGRNPAHRSENPGRPAYEYDGTRLARSVIYAANCHGYADNETQKPEAIVRPLMEYACPPRGLIFSPFGGAGTDGVVAKATGRRAILCELREQQCEATVRRLAQEVLPMRGVA